MSFGLGFMESYFNIILPYYVFDLVFSEKLSFVYKKRFESQPEDSFIKKAETCRCYDCIISFNCTHTIKVASDCTSIYIPLIIDNTAGMLRL